MPQETKITTGTVIGDTYRLNAKIGAGGMGEVWVAEHTRLPGLEVAVKFLFGGKVKEDDFSRFQREAYIMASLHHPHITKVIDLNMLPDGETPYIVLELLKGEPLSDRLKRGGLDAREVCHIIAQVGSALQATHSKEIIHRDLKPDNIFLCETPEGDLPHVKVLDFGVSKVRSLEKNITVQEQGFLGTPQYMSPEQAMGNADVDQAADQFSLGIISYEMLSGYLPFGGEQLMQIITSIVQSEPIPLRELAPELSRDVEQVVHRALSKSKEGRFPNCNAYVSALVQAMMSLEETHDDWDIESLTEIIGAEGDGEPEGGDTLMMKNITQQLSATQPELMMASSPLEGDDKTRVDADGPAPTRARVRASSPQDELVSQAFTFSSLWKLPSAQGGASELKEWTGGSSTSSSQQDPLVRAQRELGADPLGGLPLPRPGKTGLRSKRSLTLMGLLGIVALAVILGRGGERVTLREVIDRIENTEELGQAEVFAPYGELIKGVKLSVTPAQRLLEPSDYEELAGTQTLPIEAGLGVEVNAYLSLSRGALKRLKLNLTELKASWSAGDERKGEARPSALGDASDGETLVLHASHYLINSEPKRWTFGLTQAEGPRDERLILVAPFELKELPKRAKARKNPPKKSRRRRPRRKRSKKKDAKK